MPRSPVTYGVCLSEAEYAECEVLRDAEHQEAFPWHFPTLYAKRGDFVVAYLGSSYDEEDRLIVGPLVMRSNDPGRRYYALRLFQRLNKLCQEAGITQYLISILESMPEYQGMCVDLGFKPIRTIEDYTWYMYAVGGSL